MMDNEGRRSDNVVGATDAFPVLASQLFARQGTYYVRMSYIEGRDFLFFTASTTETNCADCGNKYHPPQTPTTWFFQKVAACSRCRWQSMNIGQNVSTVNSGASDREFPAHGSVHPLTASRSE